MKAVLVALKLETTYDIPPQLARAVPRPSERFRWLIQKSDKNDEQHRLLYLIVS